MNGREKILAAVRRHRLEPTELPRDHDNWIRYESALEQFRQVLGSVGGEARCVADPDALIADLRHLPAYQKATTRCCAVLVANPSDTKGEGMATPDPEGGAADLRVQLPGDWNVDLGHVGDPHSLADLDLAVLPGEFAVAENAAVWVTDRDVPQRAAYFIAQHLVLVVPAAELVHNLHEAYARLRFAGQSFGCFVSGPSKTADIEQSLVIGAHGARSLTVYLLARGLEATGSAEPRMLPSPR